MSLESSDNGTGATPDDSSPEIRPGVLDHGFNMIAKDMDRAFALGLSANQAVIMNSVREQSWTAAILVRKKGEPRPDPIPAQLNLSHLATTAGVNRSRLSTALKGLFNGGLLRRLESYVLINKDYSKWLDDEGKSPRFSSVQLEYIRAVKRVRKQPSVAFCNSDALLQNATVDNPSCCVSQHELLQNATLTVANCNSATIGARASEDLETSERCSYGTSSDRTAEATGTTGREKVTVKDLIDEARRLHGEAVAKEVTYRAGEILGTFGDDELGCYLAAIRQGAKTRKTIDFPHPWFMTTAKNLRNQGVSGDPASIAPKPADTAADRRRRQDDAFAKAASEIEDI